MTVHVSRSVPREPLRARLISKILYLRQRYHFSPERIEYRQSAKESLTPHVVSPIRARRPLKRIELLDVMLPVIAMGRTGLGVVGTAL